MRGHKMTNKEDGTNDQLEQSLIDVAVESWRFARSFSRVVNKLDAGESTRYVNQLRYFQKKVEESLEASGLKIVNVEGQPFDPGIAASALNIGDSVLMTSCWLIKWWSQPSWDQRACGSRAR